jgi:hypothetical protein
MIIACFAQALTGGGHAVTVIGVLVVWRFIVGSSFCRGPSSFDFDDYVRWVLVLVATIPLAPSFRPNLHQLAFADA